MSIKHTIHIGKAIDTVLWTEDKEMTGVRQGILMYVMTTNLFVEASSRA
jgi:hypothetical protein